MTVTARYSASATTTRARPCGSVRADSDLRHRAVGAPDAEDGLVAVAGAVLQPGRQLRRAEGLAAHLQRHEVGMVVDGREHPAALGVDRPANVPARAVAK